MARRSRDEWIKLVEESQSSGMTQAAFCGAGDLASRTSVLDEGELRDEEASPNKAAAPGLLPLHIADGVSDEGVEVLLPNGVHLRFSPAAKPSYVAAILSALAA